MGTHKRIHRLIYLNKSNIRQALHELRDDEKKIENFLEEKNRPEELLYRIEIERGHPLLVIRFVSSSKNNGFAIPKESAWVVQVALNRLFEAWELKNRILDQIAVRRKGWETEDRAMACARNLCGKNFGGFGISDVRRANRSEDRLGTDFFVVVRHLGGTREIPLQVKSSEKGRKEHIKLYPHIPSICVPCREGDNAIRGLILEIVRNFLAGKIVHV